MSEKGLPTAKINSDLSSRMSDVGEVMAAYRPEGLRYDDMYTSPYDPRKPPKFHETSTRLEPKVLTHLSRMNITGLNFGLRQLFEPVPETSSLSDTTHEMLLRSPKGVIRLTIECPRFVRTWEEYDDNTHHFGYVARYSVSLMREPGHREDSVKEDAEAAIKSLIDRLARIISLETEVQLIRESRGGSPEVLSKLGLSMFGAIEQFDGKTFDWDGNPYLGSYLGFEGYHSGGLMSGLSERLGWDREIYMKPEKERTLKEKPQLPPVVQGQGDW